MNDKIKAILEKHRIQTDPKLLGVSDLNNAIIEICEEQKKECAERFSKQGLLYKAISELILNQKNIAQ